jgi:hypothetical protein
MRKGVIVTLALAGLLVAVGLTLAASSLADQNLPREGHVVRIVHVPTVPTAVATPAPTPTSTGIGAASKTSGAPTGGSQGSTNRRAASPTVSPDPADAGRAGINRGVPGSDD